MHLVAIAAAAGITLTWDDLSDLSAAVPLLTRIYPNGTADINHFVAAGGTPFLIHTLLKHGYLHDDVLTVSGRGLWRHTREARLDGDAVVWEEGPKSSLDTVGAAPGRRPVRPGRRPADARRAASVARSSRPPPSSPSTASSPRRRWSSTTRPTSSPPSPRAASTAATWSRSIRYQGPAANGMPELHKLMPALGVLQDRGQRVAIVTDGRMSGASGKVPAAIHVTPEAALGGPLGRVRDGDLVTVDAEPGLLELDVPDAEFERRETTGRAPHDVEWAGTGRELFAGFRAIVGTAETGASVIRPLPAPTEEAPVAQRA